MKYDFIYQSRLQIKKRSKEKKFVCRKFKAGVTYLCKTNLHLTPLLFAGIIYKAKTFVQPNAESFVIFCLLSTPTAHMNAY